MSNKPSWVWMITAFLLFFALYACTAQRGTGWQDSGEYQYRILVGDYIWHSGIARAHPLYIALARSFVAGFPRAAACHAANLFSGVGLAMALALLGVAVVRLTGSFRAAAAAAVLLGFSHMAWWLATVAEVYTWSLAFLMAEVVCLIRHAEKPDAPAGGRAGINRSSAWLGALFLVNGLHLSLHNAALLGLPVYGVALIAWARRLDRGHAMGVAVGCLALWLAGGGLIFWQAVGMVRQGAGFPATLSSVLFGYGYAGRVIGTGGVDIKVWLANLALAGVSLFNPCWLFAWRGARRSCGCGRVLPVRRMLVALTLLHALFWVRYFVADQATFVLPTLGLFALWAGLGVADAAFTFRRLALCVVVGATCATAGPAVLCHVVRLSGYDSLRARTLPFRDEACYWLIPWKQGENSAERFIAAVGNQLKAGDLLVADATATGPLLAAREAGTLADGWMLATPWSGLSDDELLALIRRADGASYIVSPVSGYAPRAVLDAGFGFERVGCLYRLSTGEEKP